MFWLETDLKSLDFLHRNEKEKLTRERRVKMISDSIEHQWLADIKTISDRCKTRDGGNRFPVDFRSGD